MKLTPHRSSADEPPVLILGSGITALGVQRVLGRGRIPYYTVTRDDRLLRRSRWFRPLPGQPGQPEPDRLTDWLEDLDLDRAVLLPCSDEWALTCAQVAHGPGDRFAASLPPHDRLRRLIDKAELLSLLEELDVPRPWTRALDGANELDAIPWDRLAGNAFLKPRDSQHFMARFGVKAVRVRSGRDARELLQELGCSGMGFVLQEYVPGDASNHYFIDGFRDIHGDVRALFVRRRLRMHPPDFGNSSFMRSVAPEEAAGAVASLERILAGVGHRGIFSAEFKRDPRDGEFKLLEVNARAWWFVEFAAQCGVDVCRSAYLDALGEPVPEVVDYPLGRRCVHPYHDYFACRELRQRGELSLGGWLTSWIGARQPVFQWMDPWPGVRGTVATLVRRSKKSLFGPRSNGPASGKGA